MMDKANNMTTKTFYCDKCEKDLNPHLHTQELPGGIVKHFLMCYACGATFTAYYTDEEIRAMQAEIRDIRTRLDKQYKEKLAKRHDKLKRQIQWRMINLRAKVEAAAEKAKEQKEEGRVEGDAE